MNLITEKEQKDKAQLFGVLYFLIYLPTFALLAISAIPSMLDTVLTGKWNDYNSLSFILSAYFIIVLALYLLWAFNYKGMVIEVAVISTILWFVGLGLIMIGPFILLSMMGSWMGSS